MLIAHLIWSWHNNRVFLKNSMLLYFDPYGGLVLPCKRHLLATLAPQMFSAGWSLLINRALISCAVWSRHHSVLVPQNLCFSYSINTILVVPCKSWHTSGDKKVSALVLMLPHFFASMFPQGRTVVAKCCFLLLCVYFKSGRILNLIDCASMVSFLNLNQLNN